MTKIIGEIDWKCNECGAINKTNVKNYSHVFKCWGCGTKYIYEDLLIDDLKEDNGIRWSSER